jgi:5'-nucleotidase
VPYLEPFKIDLFLSANEKDVQEAINANFAAAKIYQNENGFNISDDKIRIAFDGDAVLFSDESERIFQQDGLEAFLAHEKKNAENNLLEGPFAKLLKTIAYIQREFPSENPPILTALVTARNSPAHERVIRTLNAWGVRIDQCFFLGGMEKNEILKAFGAQIFFDDQDVHCKRAYQVVPTARVPYRIPPPVEAEVGPNAAQEGDVQSRALVMGEGLPPIDENDEPVSAQDDFQRDWGVISERAEALPEGPGTPQNSASD